MEEQLKQALRDKLQALTKDELIEIITNITSAYVAMSVFGRVNELNSVQQHVNRTYLDLTKVAVKNQKELLV